MALKMSSSGKVIKLFYDVISPYSYLTFEALCRYKKVWDIKLKLKPVYLPGIILGSGNQAADGIPNKLHYMTSELMMLSEYFGVPMFTPPNLSAKQSLSAMRFVTAVAEKDKERNVLVERVSRELWTRMWQTHQDITQPASFTEVGVKAGLSTNEVEEILSLANSQPIKEKLQTVTKEALDNKCFGLPFIMCQVDMKTAFFFGSDKLELMAYFLGEKWMGPHPTKTITTM